MKKSEKQRSVKQIHDFFSPAQPVKSSRVSGKEAAKAVLYFLENNTPAKTKDKRHKTYQKRWEAYQDFIDERHTRFPGHHYSALICAAANHFHVDLKTIKRHTIPPV